MKYLARMPHNRKYNEHEIRQLMRRATEKQRRSNEEDAAGLSLEEIKRIAAEVGVNPKFVEMAAEELGDDSLTTKVSKVLGGSYELESKRRTPGVLDGKAMAAIAASIRQHSKSDAGHIETLGDSLHWRTSSGNINTRSLIVSDDGGNCSISASAAYGGYAALLQMAPGFMTLIGIMMIAGKGELAPGIALLSIAAVLFVAMRFAYSSIARKMEKDSIELVDEVESAIVKAAERARQLETSAAVNQAPTRTAAAQPTAPNLLKDADSYGPNDGKSQEKKSRNESWL